MKRKETKIVLIVFGVAILTRGLTLLVPVLGSDETTVGLMGLRVMAGDFPVFFFGQNFMGSLEAYLGGSFFYFWGPSPSTLVFLPVFFSLLFLFLLYLSTKAFLDSKTAQWSIASLSIPPLFLLGWAHEARLHYHFVLIFGHFLLLITHKIVYRNGTPFTKRLLFILLGLLSGVAWWTNYLSITYFLPIAFFLFLKDKKILFSKNILWLILCFLIGGSPLWVYNIFHQFPIMGITNPVSGSNWWPYLRDFLVNALPIILGLLPPLNQDKLDYSVYWIIGPIFGISFVYYLYKYRRSLTGIILLRFPEKKGGEILVLIFLVNIALNLFTHYGIRLSDNDQKYLFPLYTALPVFLAVFLLDLKKFSSGLSWGLLGIILFSNLMGDLRHDGWVILNRKQVSEYQEKEKIKIRLIDFLKKNELDRSYYGSEGASLTFKSKEAIIFAHPYQEGCLKYADLVDASRKPVYISHGEDKVFEENMKALGGSYRKIRATDGHLIYSDFIPPRQDSLRILPRNLWTATASLNAAAANQAFDGNVSTGWGTGGPQKQGTFFLLDLGRMEQVGKISYLPASYREIPAGYEVAASLEGKTWQTVAHVAEYRGPLFWSGPNPMTKLRQGRIEIVFPSHRCRFIKISLLANGNDNPWSINELFAFSPENHFGNIRTSLPKEEEIDHLLAFLKAQKVKFVYTGPWLSAVIRVKSQGKIGALISNLFLGDNGENVPEADRFTAAVLTPKVGLIVEKEENRSLGKILQEADRFHRQKEIGPFMVYYDFKSLKDQPFLSLKEVKVSSNANSSEAKKAVDGNPKTRWTSGRPQEPGLYFQVDLGNIQSIKGCSLVVGQSVDDYPRSLRFLYSLDGHSWQEVEAEVQMELYWTGETLLNMIGEKTGYFFPPLSLRYLKLLQEGRDPVYYWSIHEINLF
jgi:hypothetical protein